jgi:hypothetical protein
MTMRLTHNTPKAKSEDWNAIVKFFYMCIYWLVASNNAWWVIMLMLPYHSIVLLH